MAKAIYLTLMLGGFSLIALGNNEMNAISADLSKMFSENPTDHAVFLMSGGFVIALLGTGGIFGLFADAKN